MSGRSVASWRLATTDPGSGGLGVAEGYRNRPVLSRETNYLLTSLTPALSVLVGEGRQECGVCDGEQGAFRLGRTMP